MYKIPVKIEGIERRKRSTGLLHIVAGFFLIANGGTYLRHINFESIHLVLPFYLVAIASLFYGFMRKKIDPLAKYNHLLRLTQVISFTSLGLIFINFSVTAQILGLFLWAIITLFLMFTERKVFHDTYLQVKEDGIHIPGYLKTHVVPWGVIEGFVVRTDFVTINRRDQKYVQLELVDDISAKDITQINQYSSFQIQQFAQLLVRP
jgi:hypothetical protein